mgnify:CR=1 FL=1
MADEMIDEEGLRRSARSQIIVDTIERSLEKMMFVESNLGKETVSYTHLTLPTIVEV